MKPMRLIYIYHSGFIIEGKEFAILIDYYRDTPESYVYRHFLKRPGRLYILSSHAHPDHFNPEILSWKPERPDIRYILSEDIRDSQKACFHDAIFLKKGEEWNDDLLKIEAFGSTDIGISFLLDVADKRIFHAGDLNNWHWEDESTPAEIREAANLSSGTGNSGPGNRLCRSSPFSCRSAFRQGLHPGSPGICRPDPYPAIRSYALLGKI